MLDQLLLEFTEELLATLQDQLLLGSAEGVFLFVQAHEIRVSRGLEEFAQTPHEVGLTHLVGGGNPLRRILQLQLEVHGQEAEEGTVHATNALDLVIQVLPVGLGAVLLVQLTDEIELVLHPQRASRGTEPTEHGGEVVGRLGGVAGGRQVHLGNRRGITRIPRCLGRDEGLDEAVGEQADIVGQLRVGTNHGFNAFVEALEVAVRTNKFVGTEKHLLVARFLSTEVAPLDGRLVMRQGLLASANEPPDLHGRFEDRVLHDGRRSEVVGVGIKALPSDVGLKPLVDLLAAHVGRNAAGEVVAQAEHMPHLVGHDLAHIILRGPQRPGVGQGFIREQVFQALGVLVSKFHRLHVAQAIGGHPGEALRGLATHGISGELLLVGHDVAHRTQQRPGASLSAQGKHTGHVSLTVFGLTRARVDEDVGVGEAGVIPRNPLHNVVARVGCGDAGRGLFGADQIGAKGAVPIQDAVLHRLHVVGRGVGAVMEDHRLGDIETGHLG